jgi:hypothetical protein
LSVSQNGDRAEVILAIQEYFQCGTIRPDRSDKTVKWEIRSLRWLLRSVLPHFAQYPLLSGKRRDFDLFADICQRMDRREHLEPVGLAAIVQMAAGMNPSGQRGYEPAVIIDQLQKMKA